MYARGATPESPHVGGWSRPPGEHVPEAPAAMPATCVAWNEASRSMASRPRRPECGPGKARATMTFGVVHFRARARIEVVRDARIDPAHERQPRELRQLRHRQRHGDPVEHDAEAAVDARLRDRTDELRRGDALRPGDTCEVATGRDRRD